VHKDRAVLLGLAVIFRWREGSRCSYARYQYLALVILLFPPMAAATALAADLPAVGQAGKLRAFGLHRTWRGAHDGCQLGARRDAQLREDPVQVVADGAVR
jgi:hypothetical protein